jgi:hypothetical protein
MKAEPLHGLFNLLHPFPHSVHRVHGSLTGSCLGKRGVMDGLSPLEIILKPTILKPTILKPTILKPTILKPTIILCRFRQLRTFPGLPCLSQVLTYRPVVPGVLLHTVTITVKHRF